MSSWRDEYREALRERDKRERVDYDLIDAYTRLADRTAALEAQKAAAISNTTSITPTKDELTDGMTSDVSAQLRSDLAETLRAKGQLQSRLKTAEEELEKLRARSLSDSKRIRDLTSERSMLRTKVKDRDSELKGKTKLVEEVQDEMVSLNLQLNMAEQRSKKLQKENKDLIDRWMERKGQEADAMNNASKFS